ncbi:uncharacterized protein LOC123263947 [Cotesia glomerata]|uniref:uncharacterized protein LOC123263947 n=1 Tax=Cotesia glomerata TaxID=32391 RepID=UPI001D02A6D7|nr:uncharacterized protein LOC123263947 [Cotesia glomerata]
MLYSNFTSPTIRICIKGIVLPESHNPSPMMGSISPNSTKIYYPQLSESAVWVYNHKEYLHINNHDIVNIMTEREIFTPSVTDPKVSKIEMVSPHRICDDDGPTIIASCHVDFQSGHGILLSHFFYLFTSWTFGHSIVQDCPNVPVYNIDKNFNPPYWPTCIIKEYAGYLNNCCNHRRELSCEDEAHKLIKFKSTHTFYIDDCKFVNLHFEDHEARNLKVSIVSDEEVLETLDLKESNGLLADFSTPVVFFTNKTDENCEAYEFSYSTIFQFAPNLGYFTLYRDQSKMAALVYSFRKPTDFSLDGNIGHYVLRHLPDSVDKSRYIFIKLLDAYQAFPDAPHEVEAKQKFDLGATHVENIIIEMVVLLDLQESE